MSHLIRSIAALALIGAQLGPVVPPVAFAQQQGTLPDAYAGLTPAQARELRATIARLTRERDVREATLVAMAARLRVDFGATSFAQMIELVEIRAQEAATLRAELATLRDRFAAIPVRADRDVAQDLLQRARAAFDAGRLGEADQLLAELTPLRGEALRVRLEDWQEVVAARARVMVVDGRVAESVAYRRDASRALDELTRQTQFAIMLQAAEDARLGGERLAGVTLLQLAVDVFVNDVLPLAPPRNRARRLGDDAEQPRQCACASGPADRRGGGGGAARTRGGSV